MFKIHWKNENKKKTTEKLESIQHYNFYFSYLLSNNFQMINFMFNGSFICEVVYVYIFII